MLSAPHVELRSSGVLRIISALGFPYSIIGALIGAVRCIAGIVQKFTFFFTGRALVWVRVRFEGVSAIGTFPAWHKTTSLIFVGCQLLVVRGQVTHFLWLYATAIGQQSLICNSWLPYNCQQSIEGASNIPYHIQLTTDHPPLITYAFQRPCRLQYSRAVTFWASVLKTASGASPGFKNCRSDLPSAMI